MGNFCDTCAQDCDVAVTPLMITLKAHEKPVAVEVQEARYTLCGERSLHNRMLDQEVIF